MDIFRIARHKLSWIAMLTSVFSVGCSSTAVLPNLQYSFMDIQKAVGESLPGGVLSVSGNQREYNSGYFNPDRLRHSEFFGTSSKKEKKKGKFERAQCTITITGDQRPYLLEVSVRIEERDNDRDVPAARREDVGAGTFYKSGYDEGLARKIANDIFDYLFKRARGKNLIDDFRPF